MQIHEESQPIAPTTAQTRVTPEEVAAAAARIEARKDASLHQFEETISIEDTIRQIGLDATPEEVLTEVQAARAGKSVSISRGKNRGEKPFQLLRPRTLLAIIGGMVLAFAWSQWEEVPEASPASVTTTVPRPMPQNTPVFIQVDLGHLQVGDDSGKLGLLSEVGDNQEGNSVFNPGIPAIVDYAEANSPGLPWTLIKHDGKLYVRGYTEPVSPQALSVKCMDVDSDPLSDAIPVTLPLSGFQVKPDPNADASKFHAVNVHLDKYAWDKS